MGVIQGSINSMIGSVSQAAAINKGIQEITKGTIAAEKSAIEAEKAANAVELENRARVAQSVTSELESKVEGVTNEFEEQQKAIDATDGTREQKQYLSDVAFKHAQGRVQSIKSSLSNSLQSRYVKGEMDFATYQKESNEEAINRLNPKPKDEPISILNKVGEHNNLFKSSKDGQLKLIKPTMTTKEYENETKAMDFIKELK